MNIISKLLTLSLCILPFLACDRLLPEDTDMNTEPGAMVPFTTASLNDMGVSYIWDETIIPEITISITKDEWNKLLKRYDEFQHNVDYFHADITYKKGTETIQVYVKALDYPEAPIKDLRGFAKLSLEPGQTGKAEIILNGESFQYYDPSIDELSTRPGRYQILYGTSSLEKDLKTIDFLVK